MNAYHVAACLVLIALVLWLTGHKHTNPGSMTRAELEENMHREEAAGRNVSVYHLEHAARYEP